MPTCGWNPAIVTPTGFARLKAKGYGQQRWQDRHIFCMQNQDASGEPAFISAAMALVFKLNQPLALIPQALTAMFMKAN